MFFSTLMSNDHDPFICYTMYAKIFAWYRFQNRNKLISVEWESIKLAEITSISMWIKIVTVQQGVNWSENEVFVPNDSMKSAIEFIPRVQQIEHIDFN